jgi:hypothetical protein
VLLELRYYSDEQWQEEEEEGLGETWMDHMREYIWRQDELGRRNRSVAWAEVG